MKGFVFPTVPSRTFSQDKDNVICLDQSMRRCRWQEAYSHDAIYTAPRSRGYTVESLCAERVGTSRY